MYFMHQFVAFLKLILNIYHTTSTPTTTTTTIHIIKIVSQKFIFMLLCHTYMYLLHAFATEFVISFLFVCFFVDIYLAFREQITYIYECIQEKKTLSMIQPI